MYLCRSDGQYARFFLNQVRLGTEGVEEILPINQLSAFEQKPRRYATNLRADIELGEKFITG